MDEVKNLDAEAVFAALTPSEAVASLREALAGDFDPADDIPRTISDISAGNMIFMPSEIGDWVGVKLAGVSVGNPERGLPRIMAQYLMYNSATLELRTVIDGAALTTLRTPAVSLAAIEPALNRFTQPVNVVIFGAGPQGTGHADTLADVLTVELADVTFVVRSPDQVTADVRDRGKVLQAQTAEVEAGLRAADIVVTATTSSEPLFSADLVKPGAVVMACGSHDPHSRELPAELFTSALVIVEDLSTVLRECGDVVLAISDGALNADSLVTMKQFSNGEVSADASQTVIFKGSGMSWEDLAVATKLVGKA
ncbi:MAG: ornithine cyclodeaminase family protein [Brevibacterium aurantiacum]|uniref:Ornithine cyclodeaminase n=1 Tax=Brevibacterium aurantiacum TaxID=273384 RepID=A0A2H1JA12_BREAU|nr:ornithine cyclodeaminase family protein [Brevibacterium aurantiacum]AZT95128.1 ornithine cyclodeaminase [Brevibacterium aurantiacum]PCC56063.1 ornithine cyclodeaminase [Brevibacterium aurantiacum]RCS93953.1 ornithine cyclodeaminase family protein [Brevibacterium aurantiacum]SMX84221.1 ornithine cyclodeaminase [Brevibacterium aurantiacum]GEB24295.1 ornithine cyclodeaminase [Brevibacterium aurantiacum]